MRSLLILMFFPFLPLYSSENVTKDLTSFNKCCNQEEVLLNSTTCIESSTEDFKIENFYIETTPVKDNISYVLAYNQLSILKFNYCTIVHKLQPENGVIEDFFVQSFGFLYLPYNEYTYLNAFCLDYSANDNKTISAVICGEHLVEPRGLINSIGMIISIFFLLLTLIVYSLFPALNLHRKALMCYVLSLLLAYLSLVLTSLNIYFKWVDDQIICAPLGYLTLYFLIAAFLWMNVLSIDIFLSFRQLRSNREMQSGKKSFFFYSIYAWGLAALHEILVYIIDKFTDDADDSLWYDPLMGNGQCFLAVRYPMLLYAYMPMALIIITNIILFSLTAIKINNIKIGTQILQNCQKRNYGRDKEIYQLYLKFFFAVGVNWFLEIISWAILQFHPHTPNFVLYVPNVCNTGYGLIIFVIFVFKKRTWKVLKNRFSKNRNSVQSHQQLTTPTAIFYSKT